MKVGLLMNSAIYKSKIAKVLHQIQNQPVPGPIIKGKVTQVIGLTVEAVGCHQAVGTRCFISLGKGELVEAEVVGFSQDKTYLMCLNYTHGISPGASLISTNKVATVKVSSRLLGRIIDGSGEPIDNLGPIMANAQYPIVSQVINPLKRAVIDKPMDVGIRAINSLITIGRGQRVGLFAGSGVGKSVLLGMMTRFTEADVIVVGLIGERGREVKEFIESNLAKEGLARSVVIAAPADSSPLMRLHGAMVATSVAEYFRDEGKHVLLLMDSLTRFAQAQREIALSVGEPPATKGYPPSVFAKLPQLVERAGNGEKGKGSITAIYTVLAEGDDVQDPIADAARAILDGHITLSRDMAERGHFPAISIESSISRVFSKVTSKEHQQAALSFRQCYAKFENNRDLISVGAYAEGADVELDRAVKLNPVQQAFLQQHTDEQVDFERSITQLNQVRQAYLQLGGT